MHRDWLPSCRPHRFQVRTHDVGHPADLGVAQRLLRPANAEEIAAVFRARTGITADEQLTAADAGVVDEAREILERDADLGARRVN